MCSSSFTGLNLNYWGVTAAWHEVALEYAIVLQVGSVSIDSTQLLCAQLCFLHHACSMQVLVMCMLLMAGVMFSCNALPEARTHLPLLLLLLLLLCLNGRSYT
jgi:hypothetical protein